MEQNTITIGNPAASTDPVYRYVQALRDISNVLGTGQCTQANCEGCHYEMEEAARIARRALDEEH